MFSSWPCTKMQIQLRDNRLIAVGAAAMDWGYLDLIYDCNCNCMEIPNQSLDRRLQVKVIYCQRQLFQKQFNCVVSPPLSVGRPLVLYVYYLCSSSVQLNTEHRPIKQRNLAVLQNSCWPAINSNPLGINRNRLGTTHLQGSIKTRTLSILLSYTRSGD